MKRVYFSGVVWVLFTISHRPLSWSSLYSLLLDSRRVSTKRDEKTVNPRQIYQQSSGFLRSPHNFEKDHLNSFCHQLVFTVFTINMFAGPKPPKFRESPKIFPTKYQLSCLLFVEKIDFLLVNQQKNSQLKQKVNKIWLKILGAKNRLKTYTTPPRTAKISGPKS